MTRIDSGELSLEDSIAAFERGVALVRSLNQKLDEVEKKVEVLTRNAEGQLKSVAFDIGADEAPAPETQGRNDRDRDDEEF